MGIIPKGKKHNNRKRRLNSVHPSLSFTMELEHDDSFPFQVTHHVFKAALFENFGRFHYK